MATVHANIAMTGVLWIRTERTMATFLRWIATPELATLRWSLLVES